MKQRANRNRKINLVTLGCSKNLVDSERLARQLVANGLEIIHDAEPADARTVIVNTCGFIRDAKEESIQSILGFAKARQKGEIDRLYVMGCLSERYKDVLQKEIGEVDAYFGVHSLEEIIGTLQLDYRKDLLGERLLSTPSHYAYLKISEGCDRTCSFCAIPLIRGRHISRPADELVKEAEYLAASGARELILIAQDLTYYGRDLGGKSRLADLLLALGDVQGIEWIRLHYAYPASFPVEILSLMRQHPKICKYLDIPFQHITDRMLTRMRRNISEEATRELLEKIRAEVPGIAIRTTMIAGHPGETPEDFDALCNFIRTARFERLGVFSYSHEEDTYAWKNYREDVPAPVREERMGTLLSIQQEISQALNHEKIGKVLPVLIDKVEGGFYLARSEYDSPDVDNEIHIPEDLARWEKGSFHRVKIVGASSFDLEAVPAE